eukprot:4245984-Karenia_brevis.AAC.1
MRVEVHHRGGCWRRVQRAISQFLTRFCLRTSSACLHGAGQGEFALHAWAASPCCVAALLSRLSRAEHAQGGPCDFGPS